MLTCAVRRQTVVNDSELRDALAIALVGTRGFRPSPEQMKVLGENQEVQKWIKE
ncbi:MAG: hypothetical protein JW841_11200 [Deltaproteobacteria bacterium]|nr:hypothetical protein [Deltaproteobacteria bacterium]